MARHPSIPLLILLTCSLSAAGAALPTAAVAIVALGVMAASTAVWAVQATNGRTISPSQLALLETASTARKAIALQLTPWSRVPLADVPGRLRIELSRALTPRRAGRETAPLFALPAIPAGRYRLHAVSEDARGWLMVGIARDPRDPFALQTVPAGAGPIDLRVPVAVRSLVIRGDEDAWRTIRGLVIEPLEVTPAAREASPQQSTMASQLSRVSSQRNGRPVVPLV